MQGITSLEIEQVALSYIFVLLVLFIIFKRGINREKDLFIASIRMTIQLVLAGFLLTYILNNPSPVLTISFIFAMECFAINTVYKRFSGKLSKKLKLIIAFSMGAGTFSCILYFLFVVIRINPWYDPQYFIPIAGMLVGNSMTGISLGIKSLLEGMKNQKSIVEEALNLGATPQMATKSIVDSTFDASIMPTINSMLGMGIVFLPGMMTGQILSGTLPTTAVAYQIIIMCGILGAVGLTVILMLQFGYRSFFNEEDQLIENNF